MQAIERSGNTLAADQPCEVVMPAQAGLTSWQRSSRCLTYRSESPTRLPCSCCTENVACPPRRRLAGALACVAQQRHRDGAAPVFARHGTRYFAVPPQRFAMHTTTAKWIAANSVRAGTRRVGSVRERRDTGLRCAATIAEAAQNRQADKAAAGRSSRRSGWLYRSGMNERAIDYILKAVSTPIAPAPCRD